MITIRRAPSADRCRRILEEMESICILQGTTDPLGSARKVAEEHEKIGFERGCGETFSEFNERVKDILRYAPLILHQDRLTVDQ